MSRKDGSKFARSDPGKFDAQNYMIWVHNSFYNSDTAPASSRVALLWKVCIRASLVASPVIILVTMDGVSCVRAPFKTDYR